MTIPILLLTKLAAVIVACLIYLSIMEAALPANSKGDRLLVSPVCMAIHYQLGECI